jgi:hypothetical protein
MEIYLKVFEGNAKLATARTFIALAILILINSVYLYLIHKSLPFKTNNTILCYTAYPIALLLISTAIAVQNPKESCNQNDHSPPTKTIAYGILVGLVVYGVLNIIMLRLIKKWTVGLAFRNTCFGIVSVGIAALFTYYSADSANLY